MPRLIFKCPYIKGGTSTASAHLENYVTYMSTRNGVEKTDPGLSQSPVTAKQQQMIKQILRDFPLSAGMPEYEDYLSAPTSGNASEFINRALEDNADRISKLDNYLRYIATRPRTQRMGSHGLFTGAKDHLVLEQVADAIANHPGKVWLPIISLRREDAARLGYDKAEEWQALLSKYAMEMDPIFMQIATSTEYTMPATNKHSSERTIYHTNDMISESRGGTLYYPYVNGIKTASTDNGRNLVSTAVKDAYSYTLVTLGAQRYYENGDEISDNMAFVDAKQLYEWAFNNWGIRSVVKTSTIITSVKVEMGKDVDEITVFPDQDVDYLMRMDIDMSSLQQVINLPDSVDAPITAGQVLGTMDLKLADTSIATVNLVAS